MENQKPVGAPITPAQSPQSGLPVQPQALPSYENPSPAAQQATAPTPAPETPRRSLQTQILGLVIVVICLVFCFVGYGLWGHSQAPRQLNLKAVSTTASITLPKDANILNACVPTKGMQYVVSKNMPTGPIYDVYQNKVIGVEYMLSQANLASAGKSYSNLPLMQAEYDHVDVRQVGPVVGMPESHTQISAMLIPASVADAITCNNQ